MTIHERHREWISARGLDPDLAEKLGMETTQDGVGYWLTAPYKENGEVVNHKHRRTGQKQFRMDAGAPLLLWNVDCLKDQKVQAGHAPVIICEGEMDCLAAIQSGFPFAVSVPNGAPAEETSEPESAKRYEWVWRHLSDLDKVGSFILATDDDTPGHNLAADLASMLGADRCKFLTYPAGCKDLNDVLLKHGASKVAELIGHAKPYPIQGLFRIEDFPEIGEVRSFPIGIPAIAELIQIVPGTLTVLTGYANQGKSTLMDAIIGHCLNTNLPVCLASFETDVKPILINALRAVMMKCGSHEIKQRDTSEVDATLSKNLMIISQSVDEDMEMDLEKFLELCRIAVVRDGAKVVCIDPWNELEHKRKDREREDEYISRALRSIKRFAKQYGIAFWIVAHPAKPVPGGRAVIPGLYEVSGAAHWANKADYGITYHRPKFDENRAKIIVNKVRKGLPGKRGVKEVMFDFRTSEFVELEPLAKEKAVKAPKSKSSSTPVKADASPWPEVDDLYPDEEM